MSNTGGSDFRYSVALTTDGDSAFGQELHFRIFQRSGTTCSFPGAPVAGHDLLATTGVVYDGSFTDGNKVGDPSVLEATGDLVLAAGQSQVLCMEILLPWDAGNQYQGKTVDGTFTFTAKTPGT